MSRIASVDGVLSPLESARVSVLDRGFLYADGVFETLRAYRGRPFARDEHLARLERSAAVLGIALPVTLGDLSRELDAALEAAAEPEAYVRIMLTRGAPSELSLVPRGEARATRIILVDAVHPPPSSAYAKGLTAITLAWGRDGDAGRGGGAKLLSYVTNLLALDEARARGADDAIFIGADGNVREAATSNLFLMDAEGHLVTPPEGPGVLGGITRRHVLELARELGIVCVVDAVPRRALAGAREVFLTSSIREIMSVVRVDGVSVGNGNPGEIARELHRALRSRVGAS